MALKLTVEQCSITTKHPFVIARGSTNGYKRAWVRVVDSDGVEGWGDTSWWRLVCCFSRVYWPG